MASELKEIFSGETCPICLNSTLSQTVLIYVEKVSKEELLLFTTSCSSCGYKHSEVLPSRKGDLARAHEYTLKVHDADDLESKIYRAPTGSIEIPELGLSLEPGVGAESFVTNIEGVLIKFKEKCNFLLRENRDNPSRISVIQKVIQDIDKAINGSFQFKVILRDSEGFSYLIPRRKENLSLAD
ncbi:MAG: ZPR1 zinc finger domain-containing protein [Promethearchaeota archaeon]